MKLTQTHKMLIIGGVLFLVFRNKATATPRGFTAFKDPARVKLLVISEALKNKGLNSPQLNFALSQMLFETGAFTNKSQVATLNNNFSGIMFINKPYQKNAVKGSPRPASEGGYYAKFLTLEDWANDFVRILNLGSKPLQATNLNEYVRRLSVNKYFDVTRPGAIENYNKGLNYYMNLLTV